jgi:CubicO group peptidase (beta-lactamase class C family)
MSRSDRGAGLRPAYRSTLARFLLSRERGVVRVRMSLALVGAICAAVALALLPQRDLHAPVLVAIEAGTPALPIENLETLAAVTLPEPAFEPVDAALAGLEPRRLGEAVAAVRQEVRRGGMPGAAVVLGRGSHVVEEQGIGRLAPGMAEVDPRETRYDLASLTKVVATTTAVMLLVEDGLLELDAPVSRYLSEFTGGSKGDVTIRHLLAHNSGLPAGVGLPAGSADASLRRIIGTPLRTRPGERVVYSDVGPIVLYAAAERVAGEPLDQLLQRRVFQPLGMRNTGFNPAGPCRSCAPTAPTIHGRVHDPLARRLGGIAGNAGLFATASDIGRFAAMMANGGELEGVRVLQEETIREFTTRQRNTGTRALGWDTPSPRGTGAGGRQTSTGSFGHTGFTGTSLWIDPDRGTWAVLLTNRTYTPRTPNRMQALRRTVNDRLAEAADRSLAD